MNYQYTLRGKNRFTGLYESVTVVAGPIEDAIEQLDSTHDEISFMRVDKVESA